MFSTNNDTEPCHTYNTMTDLNSARTMLNKDDRFARSLAITNKDLELVRRKRGFYKISHK